MDFINLIIIKSECKTTKGALKQNVMLKSILIPWDKCYEAVKFSKISPLAPPPQKKRLQTNQGRANSSKAA